MTNSTNSTIAELDRSCALVAKCVKGARVVFFADATHVRRERGHATGRRHACNNGVEVSVLGTLHSVPAERLVEVRP